MLIGCGDCNPSATCDIKLLVAVVTPYGYTGPDGTSNPVSEAITQGGCSNYCPGIYTTSGGPEDCGVATSCGSIENIVNWLNGAWDNFSDDTTYPWNTVTTAFFQDGSAGSPYVVKGPGSTYGFGAPSYGSTYTVGYDTAALEGSAIGGNLCAFVQAAAYRITGNLYIVPSGWDDAPEQCIETLGGFCIPGGGAGTGTYYIPLPPTDLCNSVDGSDFSIQYAVYQTGNSDSCLPGFPGGDYTTCQSPDPFFGSDPP